MSDSQIKTGRQIRQDFLDFFQSKRHSIVPSDNLGYLSPDGAKIFTNAGMNQFVPIFLGERKADVDKWPGAITDENTLPTRAADTQKCIRAGGKHNDLDDVGLDTYHHTFFEMLGNWSFGDYFKKEAIEWAWELLTGVWKFPKERLYATVFCPHMDMDKWREELTDAVSFAQEAIVGTTVQPTQSTNEANTAFNRSDFDAARFWASHFIKAELNPMTHIVPGNKKDNFWMMGDTGPCGPCSELHIDLTQQGDTKGALVNKDSSECIEIWNLVFIQFNANADGTFSPLPARHVDTGMGFERVCSVVQNTKGFRDFKRGTSNYETDVFRPIFDKLEALSGKKYGSTLPREGSTGHNEQEKIDIAFRVIADHIRTLTFSIADGLIPGNTDRNYTLRRILRRAVRYGRTLGFHEPFFYKLVDVLVAEMGDFFPEIREKQDFATTTIKTEEVAFNKTLDRGIELFEEEIQIIDEFRQFVSNVPDSVKGLESKFDSLHSVDKLVNLDCESFVADIIELTRAEFDATTSHPGLLPSEIAAIENADFISSVSLWRGLWAGSTAGLYDVTNEWINNDFDHPFLWDNSSRFKDGFARVLVEAQRATEQIKIFPGSTAFKLYDTYGFPLDLTEVMARERGLTVDHAGFEAEMAQQRARARAAQKKEIIEITELGDIPATNFIGFDALTTTAKVQEVVKLKDKTAVILETSPFYAEMGGQLGDSGEISHGGSLWRVTNTQKSGHAFLHLLDEDADDLAAGMEVELSVDAERRAAIQRHHSVTHIFHWALHEIASRDATQKGSYVGPDKLTFDFNSAALTPQQLRDIEKLVNERIVENAGISWTEVPYTEARENKGITQLFGEKYGETVRVVQIGGEAGSLNGWSMELCGGTHTRATGEIGLFRIVGESAIAAGTRRIEAIAGMEAYAKARQEAELIATLAGKVNSPVGELEKKLENLVAQQKQLEKQLKSMKQKQAGADAKELIAKATEIGGKPAIIENMGDEDGNYCQAIADALRGEFNGVVVLAGSAEGSVALVATVSKDLTGSIRAGDIIKEIAPIVGGKGGGKPDQARGGGKDVSKVGEALEKARALLAD